MGAWIADSYWGRFRTILVFSWVYLAGMLLLALSAAHPALTPARGEAASALQFGVLYLSLYVVAVGTGGIKPNVSAFGADQFDPRDPRDARDKESFFNWFYFSVNIGSLIASLLIVYVQEQISWAIGFAIPGGAMLLSVAVFMGGTARYKHSAPSESPIARVVRVVAASLRHRGAPRAAVDAELDREARDRAVRGKPLRKTASHAWLERAVVGGGGPGAGGDEEAGARGLRRPGPRFTLRQVEEVKRVLRLMPIFATMIMFWAVYAQMSSLFVIQGEQMDRSVSVGGATVVMPAASLSAVDTLTIIGLIPLYDRWVVPALARAGRKPTQLQRMTWGLWVALLAMAASALVEARRLSLARRGAFLPPADGEPADAPRVVAMSVLWQVPQYFLVGASEVLTAIGQLEFFYEEAPKVMRSCMMALELLSTALGAYLAGFLIYAVRVATRALGGAGGGWIPRDLNDGHLDWYYWCLAAMMLGNIALFARAAAQYARRNRVVHHGGGVRAGLPAGAELLASTVTRAAGGLPPRAPAAGGGEGPPAAAGVGVPAAAGVGIPGAAGGRPRGPPRRLSAGEMSDASDDDQYGRSLAVPGTPAVQHFPVQKR